MSAMQYRHITDDLAYELRHQAPEPYGPNARPPAKTEPLSSRVKPSALYTFEPTGHPSRLRVYLGALYLGDVVVFPTGWRAYLPDTDGAQPGLYSSKLSAAWALRVRR